MKINYSNDRCIVFGANKETIEALAIMLTALDIDDNPTVVSALEGLRTAVFMVDSARVGRRIDILDASIKEYEKLAEGARMATTAGYHPITLGNAPSTRVNMSGQSSSLPPPKPRITPTRKWWQPWK